MRISFFVLTLLALIELTSTTNSTLYDVYYTNKRLTHFLIGPRWKLFSTNRYSFRGVEYRSNGFYGVGYSTAMLLVPSAKKRGTKEKHLWEASCKSDVRVVPIHAGDEFCGFPTPRARSKLTPQLRQALSKSHVRLHGNFNVSDWKGPSIRNYWSTREPGTLLLWPRTILHEDRQQVDVWNYSIKTSAKDKLYYPSSKTSSLLIPENMIDQDNLALLDIPRFMPLGPREKFPVVRDEVSNFLNYRKMLSPFSILFFDPIMMRIFQSIRPPSDRRYFVNMMVSISTNKIKKNFVFLTIVFVEFIIAFLAGFSDINAIFFIPPK